MQEATLITGGGKGIGAAIARRMASCGVVFLVGRNEPALADRCAAIRSAGGEADYYAGSVSDPKTALDSFAKLQSNGWFVRNLSLNAGVGYGGATESYAGTRFIETIEVNVFGSFYFAKQFLPAMIERKQGYVVLVSSIAGIEGAKREVAYSAAKGAQVLMAMSMAKEFGKHGIVSIPICPDFVESEMTDPVISGLVDHRIPKITRADAEMIVRNATRQKRIVPAEEVADVVATICNGTLDAFNGQRFLWVEDLGVKHE